MIERAQGLILRVRPFTETSLVVQWLTPEFGRLDTVAKGARRPKSPLRGKLDIFYLADFNFVRSRRSELHTLREVGLRETHAVLRQELDYLRQAAYGAALIEQTTERETPLPKIFELLLAFVQALPPRPPQPQNIFAFEMKLLHELGQAPDLDASHLTPGSRKILGALAATDWPAVSQLKLSAPQVTELQQFLHGFLIFHLGKIPKGRSAALSH